MTFQPPEAVSRAARRGLELRASLPPSRRCCTSVGLRRASQLANGQPVSLETARRMVRYFQRHGNAAEVTASGWGRDSKGWQAWLCWGGSPGYAWAKRIVREAERGSR